MMITDRVFRRWRIMLYPMAGALLLANALFWLLIVSPLQTQRDDVTDEHQRRLSILSSIQGASKDPLRRATNYLAALADAEESVKIMQTLAEKSERHGIALQEISFKPGMLQKTLPQTAEFVVPASGGYKQIEAYLLDLLSEHRFLELTSLSIQRHRVGDGVVEARMQFTLYLSP